MWAIKVKSDGTPLFHRQLPDDANLLTKKVKDKDYWVVSELVKPQLGTGQVYEEPVLDAKKAQIVYTVRDKTAQELVDEQQSNDIAALRNAGKDVALVLVEFIEWALANTQMAATDFSPDVRKAFHELKAIADRLR